MAKEYCEAAIYLAEFLSREVPGKIGSTLNGRPLTPGQNKNISRYRTIPVKEHATLGTLQGLADLFDVEPWQMLYPNFDRKRPPNLLELSKQALQAATLLDALEDEVLRDQLVVILSHSIQMAKEHAGRTGPGGGPPAPTPRPKRRRP